MIRCPQQLFILKLRINVFSCCRKFSAVDARTLRAAVGTFCDMLRLATKTLEVFGKSKDDEVSIAEMNVETNVNNNVQ